MVLVSLTKQARKIHRIVAIPAALFIPFMIVMRLVNPGMDQALGGAGLALQTVMMGTLGLTGIVLFLGPKLIRKAGRIQKD